MSFLPLPFGYHADGTPNYVVGGATFFVAAVAAQYSTLELVPATRPLYLLRVKLLANNCYLGSYPATQIDTGSTDVSPTSASAWGRAGSVLDAGLVRGYATSNKHTATPGSLQDYIHQSENQTYQMELERFVPPGERAVLMCNSPNLAIQGSIDWAELLDF